MEIKTESTEIIPLDSFQKKRKYPTINFTTEAGSNISLRPDSPKTKEACRILGIDPEILKKKLHRSIFFFFKSP